MTSRILNARSEWWTDAYEKYARALSAQTEYRVMEGASHFLMLERPMEFNALLRELLEKFHLVVE